MILNDGPVEITNTSRQLKDMWETLEKVKEKKKGHEGSLDYEEIRMSEEYRQFEYSVRVLQAIDPLDVPAGPARKSFWVNLYNILAIHAVLKFHIKLTVWERPNFFYAAEYNVGGYRFSLIDIHHGILRGNKKPWLFFSPPFRKNDPRKHFVLKYFDPRIHFALHSGSRSCPPVRVYSEDTIDDQLEQTARDFVNGSEFFFDAEKRVLVCSKIIKWYADDFGDSPEDRIEFLGQFVDDPDIRRIFIKESYTVKLKYKPYDWHLDS